MGNSFKNSRKLYEKYWRKATHLGDCHIDLGKNYSRILDLDFLRSLTLSDESFVFVRDIIFELEGESIRYD